MNTTFKITNRMIDFGGNSMHLRKIGSLLLVGLLSIVLVGCSSVEEDVKEGVAVIHSTLDSEPKEATKQLEKMDLYYPFYFEVVEEEDNNVILTDGSQQFILFYNDQEDSKSRLNYDTAIEQKEYLYKEEIEMDESFTYILIDQVDEKSIEVTIGIGGNKITSQMKSNALLDNGKLMTNIIRSVTLKQEVEQ